MMSFRSITQHALTLLLALSICACLSDSRITRIGTHEFTAAFGNRMPVDTQYTGDLRIAPMSELTGLLTRVKPPLLFIQ